MATSLQLFLLQWCMNFSSLKSVVCLQQWVKHELRPLLSLHKLTLCYIRHEHFKEGTTDTPLPSPQNIINKKLTQMLAVSQLES